MNIRKIHKSFVTSWTPLLIALLIFVALRIFWIDRGKPWELWGSMLIQIGIAMFLLFLTQKYVIIREKTLLSAFFYLLLVGTNPLLFQDLRGSIAAFLIVFCLWILFDTFQNPLSQRNALNISLILALGSFYWVPLLLFFPLIWYGMRQLKSLNLKTFFASFMGLGVVCLFLLAWSVYKNDWAVFLQVLPDLSALWDFRFPLSMDIKELVTNSLLGILLLISAIDIFMAGVSEKVQSRTFLGYLTVLAVVFSMLFLFQNQWEKEWLSILYVPISLLFARYFTVSQKLGTVWLFLLVIVFFLLRLAWPYLYAIFF